MCLLKLSILVLFLLSSKSVFATESPSPIEVELGSELQGIIASCKSTTDADSCILEKLEKKRRLYEFFLHETTPAAWSDVHVISFGFFHVNLQVSRELIRCSALSPPAKQSCIAQVPSITSGAREEVRQILIGKGGASNRLEAAERNVKERQPQDEYWSEQRKHEMDLASKQWLRQRERREEQRLRQEEIRAQREHELELARIQALGLIMQGQGFFRQQPPPAYQPQPAPVPTVPLYQPNPVRPPVSCTSHAVGSMLYTDCY